MFLRKIKLILIQLYKIHKQTENRNKKKRRTVESKSNIHDNKIVVDRPPT